MVRTAALLRAAEVRFPDFDPPNLIVVGIDYPPTSGSAILSLRARDYSPTKSPDYKKWPGTPSGGAKKFLRFIRDELMPNINSSYRTDPTDSTIVGHSFGGLFALYVLFHEPDAFRRYVASSPPLSYDNKVLFEHEREYASKHTELPAKLFLSVGSLVESEGSNAVPNLKELVEILAQRKYKGLELESHIFEDEGHMCVIGTAICRGISSVFSSARALLYQRFSWRK